MLVIIFVAGKAMEFKMALRNIVKDGDPVLNKVCRKVEKFDGRLAVLLDDMRDTLAQADGVGLAAPQVGVLRRVVIVDVGDGLLELVNPEIISVDGSEEEASEGCLSCPGVYGIVSRPKIVRLKAQDRNGNWCVYKGEGLKARCFCHELDHLDGVLFTSKIIRMDEE